VLTTTAIFAMSWAPTYRRAVESVLLIGFGAAAVSMATIKLMPKAFFASEHAGQAICLGHVFIALGALVTPALADLLVHRLGFRRAVAVLAILCLVPAFLCAVPAVGHAVDSAAAAPRTESLFAGDNLWCLLVAGAVFFFYAPLEGALSVWVTTYLTDIGDGERRATWVLSGFWAALLGSRLLAALIPFSVRWYPWLIVIPALATVVVLGNLAGSGERAAKRNGLLFVGFLLGPIFPMLLAVLWKRFQHDLGLAYGCVFAMGSFGALILAPLVSARTHSGEAKAPFRVPIALALVLTTAAMVFALTVGTGEQKPEPTPARHKHK
jgi:hypothetical protein